ncbi:glycosyltransferase family 2 protein [Bradyrhizobium sp. HKCCYLS3077]|uniref:glycosyltransferase family 2 protein n=1 Tax=unclassified Bradyrhizobium TaxID=2631580 RepID=UPI003EB81DF6
MCDVTVVLVNYNTEHLLERVFAALFAARQTLSMQTIVVDNASRDNSVAILRHGYPDVELIANTTNVGFGRANNQALPRIRGRYILLLNTDAFVADDTLTKTVAYMDEHPQCGVLGVRLVSESGALQPSCRYFPTPWNVFLAENGLGRFFPRVQMVDDMDWDHVGTRSCDWVPGCFYLMRKSAIEQVGLFDPLFFVYYEEVDHCRRIRQAEWRVTYFGEATVIHIGGESAGADDKLTTSGRQIARLQIESEMLYFRKHHGLSGLLTYLALTGCGAALELVKDVVRPVQGRLRNTQLQKLKLAVSLLGPTGWATRPTR